MRRQRSMPPTWLLHQQQPASRQLHYQPGQEPSADWVLDCRKNAIT
jgi:hypothetical protein